MQTSCNALSGVAGGRTFPAFAYNPPFTARSNELLQCQVFFCCNPRDPPDARCNNHGTSDISAYAKQRIKELGRSGKGKTRMNKSGCLDRCDEGLVIVVYPDAVCYTYVDRHDIDEIIDSKVVHGHVVDRLKI